METDKKIAFVAVSSYALTPSTSSLSIGTNLLSPVTMLISKHFNFTINTRKFIVLSPCILPFIIKFFVYPKPILDKSQTTALCPPSQFCSVNNPLVISLLPLLTHHNFVNSVFYSWKVYLASACHTCSPPQIKFNAWNDTN